LSYARMEKYFTAPPSQAKSKYDKPRSKAGLRLAAD